MKNYSTDHPRSYSGQAWSSLWGANLVHHVFACTALALLVIMAAMTSTMVQASDPDQLQDFCVADLTTTFGVVFHIFPIDFPHCCHAFDDSYHRLYVTNLYQNMGKLWVKGVAKVWDIEA
ncbi:hypothetical protein CY35_05G013000 [Sphagnum magellanicum]|nr:hypothetical protein CY35_05G013000 [Sphagnum magellanicum]